MSIAYLLVHGDPLSRVLPEFKNLLPLTLETRVGDWFIIESCTLIRVYGFEGEPYMLSKSLTPRKFSSNYTRKKFIIMIMIIWPDIVKISHSSNQRR